MQPSMIFILTERCLLLVLRRGDTLKILVDHAYLICSNFPLRKKGIYHLKNVFNKNDYPKWIINQTLNKVEKITKLLQIMKAKNYKFHL